MPPRPRYLPLFARVAAINVVLLLAAVAVTIVVLIPGHESSYRVDEEGLLLAVAVLLMLVVNLFLLRRVVRPVQRVTALARTVDLTDPRPSLPDARSNSEAGELSTTFNEMLRRLATERREATGRVLAGQEAERLRIAQELHDQVGQELTAVLLLLSRLEGRVPGELRPSLRDVQNSVRLSLEDVRRIAIELRPEALEDLGLESALAVLCDRLAQRSGMAISCEIDSELPQLSSDTELVIYRVAQEALTNVARHSGSQRAELRVQRDHCGVILTVRDRGRGLPADLGDGSGMRGMRERAALIGATLEVRNTDPGVEVRLQVPAEVAAWSR
jgi:two-component system, NarL family, sensor histidine kinase UhpB